MLEIPGYQLFRQDRQGTRGGGLGLYVREDFVCDTNKWDHLNQVKESSEMLWMTIKLRGSKKKSLLPLYTDPLMET